MKNWILILATMVGCGGVCGDGKVDENVGEECDDGNRIGGDACNEVCLVPRCGNNFPDIGLGEQCDDGNNSNQDLCLDDCSDPECGDGFLFLALEECDDGNQEDGDGCSVICDIE